MVIFKVYYGHSYFYGFNLFSLVKYMLRELILTNFETMQKGVKIAKCLHLSGMWETRQREEPISKLRYIFILYTIRPR